MSTSTNVSTVTGNTVVATPCSLSSSSSILRGPPSLHLLEGLCRQPIKQQQDIVVGQVLSKWRAMKRIVRFVELSYSFSKGKRISDSTVVSMEQERLKQQQDEEDEVSTSRPTKRRRRGGSNSSAATAAASSTTTMATSSTSKTSSKKGGKKNAPKKHQECQAVDPPSRALVDSAAAAVTRKVNEIAIVKRSSQEPLISHWLIKSLASPSRTERIVACRLLVQGCPLDDHNICSLLEVIVQVLCSHELNKIGTNSLAASNGTDGLNKDGNDLAVSSTSSLQLSCTCITGWISLLKHVIFHVLSSEQILAYARHPTSGLRWLCSTLWNLTALRSSSHHTQIGREYRSVCLSIVDLIHSLVLTGNEDTVPTIHKLLWTTNTSSSATASTNQTTTVPGPVIPKDAAPSSESTPAKSSVVGSPDLIHSSPLMMMSPLACLIGTYHIWKESDPESFMEPYLSKMQRLIDPNFLPSPTPKSNPPPLQIDISSANQPSLSVIFDKIAPLNGSTETSGDNATDNSESTSRAEPKVQDIEPAIGSDSDGVVVSVPGARDRVSSQEENKEQPAGVELDGNGDSGHDDENTRTGEDDEEAEVAEGHDGDHAGIEGIEENEDRSVESEIIDDDDDDDDDDEMIHDDIDDAFGAFAQLEQLIDLQHSVSTQQDASEPVETEGKEERSQLYIEAAMNVLASQYRPKGPARFLSVSAESILLDNILKIVKPQKKPLAGTIILRRATSQEEFFPRNLSRNPVTFQMLTKGPNDGSEYEPTVRDLRRHIADDLQMADAAEMIEILVANKILDVDLKLRVVIQTLWKDHLISQSSSSSTSGAFVSSMLASSAGRTRSFTIDSKNLMVATYRLCGVDGEATEDTVSSADLVDPEAPTGSSSPDEVERLLEKEYGLTRYVTKGRGVQSLLRSIEWNISDTLRKIRRDDIGEVHKNPSRQDFKDKIFPGIILLLHASKLSKNRRMLLQARAPTTLLSLMLDTLHALEEDNRKNDSSGTNNATAKSLQELIEVLASDISCNAQNENNENEDENDEDIERDASTLRHVLTALQTSSLSRPLRNMIAKLLPYLAYGKQELVKELATEYILHVDIKALRNFEPIDDDENTGRAGDNLIGNERSVLMDTFIHTSVSLPCNAVCDALRVELAARGFIEQLANEILSKAPTEPPSWSAALFSTALTSAKREKLESKWREFFAEPGLKLAFEIILGLAKGHGGVQSAVAKSSNPKGINFLTLCHWLESTSDNTSAGIQVKNLGLQAEKLLDEIADNRSEGNASEAVAHLRKSTRDRKKQLAMERRNKTLLGMSKFSGGHVSFAGPTTKDNDTTGGVRGAAALILAPVLGLFRDQQGTDGHGRSPAKKRKSSQNAAEMAVAKPAWMLEMENLEVETGLTCSVCQEGRVSQPNELLGLYAYVSRVALTGDVGRKESIEGWNMLRSLPETLPASLGDNFLVIKWHQDGRGAVEALQRIESRHPVSSSAAAAISRRGTYYTTTISAGNAIHTNCHREAVKADRNHPKAPKSEWEGAALRNNRCQTNVIFPLLSSRSSGISLMTLESAMADHQTAVSNLLGAMPVSTLWNILHDTLLLLLRLSYGEDISGEVGGGSRKSNTQLLFYQLISADMHNNTTIVETPDFSEHAIALSSGFLAAVCISSAFDYQPQTTTSRNSTLSRGIADSSPMAALTCILLHNNKDENTETVTTKPSPNRRWVVGKDRFLVGLLHTAGLRHALNIKSSGCLPPTRSIGSKRSRSMSCHDWDVPSSEDPGIKDHNQSSSHLLADFGSSLRPFLCLFAMFNQLSADFSADMDDIAVDEASDRLVQVIEKCQRARNINELIEITGINLSHEEILKEFNKGVLSA